MRLTCGASIARPTHLIRAMVLTLRYRPYLLRMRLTFTLLAMAVDTRTGYHDIVNDGEDAFAADPAAITRRNPGIVKDCSFVQYNTAAVYPSCEGDFFRMEKVKARSTLDLVGTVAQYLRDGV